MKRKNVFWGLFLLLGAAFIIISQIGLFEEISVVKIVFAVLLTGIALSGLMHLEFTLVLFPIAIILIMFDNEMGITKITPWPVLATALLGSIGLSLIFHRHNKPHAFIFGVDDFEKEVVIDDPDLGDVSCFAHMGSTVKYINTKEFEKGLVDCSFGAATVYFDNAEIKDNSAILKVNCSFGGIELYIPKNWQIEQRIDVFLGGIDEKGRKDQTNDGPTLILTGRIKFAGITIYYV